MEFIGSFWVIWGVWEHVVGNGVLLVEVLRFIPPEICLVVSGCGWVWISESWASGEVAVDSDRLKRNEAR